MKDRKTAIVSSNQQLTNSLCINLGPTLKSNGSCSIAVMSPLFAALTESSGAANSGLFTLCCPISFLVYGDICMTLKEDLDPEPLRFIFTLYQKVW